MVPVPWYCTGTGTGTGPGTGTGAGTGAGKAPVPVTGKALFAKHDSAGRAAAIRFDRLRAMVCSAGRTPCFTLATHPLAHGMCSGVVT